MLIIQGLNKSYGEQNVLNDINLNVETGEIISVVGSSGSGKTTLLRLVSGLEIPESGEIILNDKIVNNQNVFVAPEKEIVHWFFKIMHCSPICLCMKIFTLVKIVQPI